MSDSLFIDILARHLQLFYQDPYRKDIPIYQPIDQATIENQLLHIYPVMDKFSSVPCFNFPTESPCLSNHFATYYLAKHERIVVGVMCGNTLDTLTEATPLVASAIAHTSAYLSRKYLKKYTKEPVPFIAGFNEMRTIHIPGHSGISMHQLCNVMYFSSDDPKEITRPMFQKAYKERLAHRLPPEERINGVSAHALDINIQIDASPKSEQFLSGDYGRLTNTKSYYNPVAMGAMVVDMMVAADMGGIFLSFQISHTVPQEIRRDLMPLLIEELRSLQLVAFYVSNKDV